MRASINRRPLTTIDVVIGEAMSGEQTERIQVKAEVIGQWAVHENVNGHAGWYCVTYVRADHPANGLTIHGVRNARVSRTTAVRVAEVLAGKFGDQPFDKEKHGDIIQAEVIKICGPEAA